MESDANGHATTRNGDRPTYFVPDGPRRFRPTGHTQGPWNPHHQHAGPALALLVRAVERCLVDTGHDVLPLGRLTCEILSPLRIEPLEAHAWVERPGRRVRLVRAELRQRGAPLVTAAAWAVRPAPAELPDHRPTPSSGAAPHGPPAVLPVTDPAQFPEWDCGFMASVEWRFAQGCFSRPGPAAVWARPRLDLVPGECLSPTQRLVLTADSANGVSAELPIDSWLSISPELTLHVTRPPRSAWLCLSAASHIRPGEAGLATAELWDLGGLVGRSHQSLLVLERETEAVARSSHSI
ncbi:thioesterase family protein [Streptomyces sp. NRRL B-1347]|uniref:thioesterase family protein n=1 Tax=Streptomyces sp. NRRL B-1347 TaxID=1476877 RepID=UPI0007C5A6E6|nr:thioesterase family protein [Streptomyces sp. NRRL B-1347]